MTQIGTSGYAEFPGRNGFSAQYFWLMLQFFCNYSAKQKPQPLVREISWIKNMTLSPSTRASYILLKRLIVSAIACARASGFVPTVTIPDPLAENAASRVFKARFGWSKS